MTPPAPAGAASLPNALAAPATNIELHVHGLPAPQGSKTRMPNGAMVEAASTTGRNNVRNWRSAVAEAAADYRADNAAITLTGPTVAELVFRFPMPKSRPAKVRLAGEGPKATKPDIDKIVRATLDALVSAGLIHDDAQVASLIAEKLEVDGWTGARIRLWKWTP